MARPQANVALSAEEYDVLMALAFLEGASASELLHPVVARFLKTEAKRSEVAKALQALHETRARKEGTLSDLRTRLRKDTGTP